MDEKNLIMTLEEHVEKVDELRRKYNTHISKLYQTIFSVCNYNEETAKHYRMAADAAPENDPSLRALMTGQCLGLMEANRHIRKFLEENEVEL